VTRDTTHFCSAASGPYSRVWFVECVRALSVVNLEIHKHNTPVISTLVIVLYIGSKTDCLCLLFVPSVILMCVSAHRHLTDRTLINKVERPIVLQIAVEVAHLSSHSQTFEMFFELLAVVAVPGTLYLLTSCASSWRRRLIQRHTGMADIPFLDIARPADHKIPGSAVVCGGR
jgi:hypothetical protein